jgi:hypothetical protein
MNADLALARAEALYFRVRGSAEPVLSCPFVYVGALGRTGSTLLAELLTSLPHSLVFHEPELAQNRLRVDARLVGELLRRGIDLEAFRRRWGGRARFLSLGAFKYELLPELTAQIGQIGVKEVAHDHWRRYLYHFPDMKTLLTARDPRDVYLSVHQRRLEGKASWRGEFTPAALAAELDRQFHYQVEMFESTESLKVRYEDLCIDDAIYERVKAFIASPIPGTGVVGGHLAATPNRQNEMALHGGEVTTRRVNRFKDEPDEGLRKEAQLTLELMPEYCRFWGYEA